MLSKVLYIVYGGCESTVMMKTTDHVEKVGRMKERSLDLYLLGKCCLGAV